MESVSCKHRLLVGEGALQLLAWRDGGRVAKYRSQVLGVSSLRGREAESPRQDRSRAAGGTGLLSRHCWEISEEVE